MAIVYAMPYGRKRRTRNTRRAYGRRKTRATRRVGRTRRQNRKVGMLRTKWINPISQQKRFKFVYTDIDFAVNLTNVNGYAAYYVFRGNSPYDPDFSGVGAQPYGWDQQMNNDMFVQYRCVASSISIYFRHDTSTATAPQVRRLHCVVAPFRDDNPILTDMSDVRMIPNHKETTYDAVTESTKGCRVSHYCSTRRMMPEISTSDYNFSGVYNGNPLLGWFWIVLFKLDQGLAAANPLAVYFDAKIKYYCTVSRYNPPNES